MSAVDNRKLIHTESTRLTWRHFALARETAISLCRRSRDGHGPTVPALALADHCLRLYDDRAPSTERAADTADTRIRSILLQAAGAREPLPPPRPEYALAVLHFVERLIGLESARLVTAPRGRRPRVQNIQFSEGRRRAVGCGTYATPDFISHAMVTSLLSATGRGQRSLDVLDLSVEGGQFPLAMLAAAKGTRHIRYFAIDRDPSALQLAERLARFSARGRRHKRFSMKTACVDSLLDSLPAAWPSEFGAIIGNPPWNGIGRSAAKRPQWPADAALTGRSDVYLAFILRAHELLAPGGYLSFVVPNGFLFNVNAAPVRRLLLEHYDFLSLHLYPQRSFVEVPCLIPISFLAQKKDRTQPRRRRSTAIVHASPGFGSPERPVGQRLVHVREVWRRQPAHAFNPLAGPGVRFLLELRSERRLSDFGELWSGGRLARTVPVRVPFSFSGVRARDIRPFHVCPRHLRSFNSEMIAFDRIPRRALLDRRKIVFQDLRYTTHPERLVAAQAGPGLYPVSTASMFVPSDEDCADYFEALLNSGFANAWYKARDISRSVKLLYLRDLPVEHDRREWKRISTWARRCRQIRGLFHQRLRKCTIWREEAYLPTRFPDLHAELVDCQHTIDSAIFRLYGFSTRHARAIQALSVARAF